jgi:dTDP-4-dehydrorhamnose reductase
VARRLLFTGATGFLGRCILPRLAQVYDCIGVGGSRSYPKGEKADLTDSAETDDLVRRCAPDIIIHAAALADVDACERNPAAAWRANVITTANLVHALETTGDSARLVLISTDQVYDGPGPHQEDDVTPVNIYGLTKLWAEDWALKSRQPLVLRTNFIGLDRNRNHGFAGWLADALARSQAITLFADVFFNPLHVDCLAEVIVELIEAGAGGRVNLGTADGGMSKADFGYRLANALGLSTASASVGSVSDVQLVARRPHDMRMAVDRLRTLLGHELETMDATISRFAAEWRAATSANAVAGRA